MRRLIAAAMIGALIALAPPVNADEPYKTMLDEPTVFTGTESLGPAADGRGEIRIGLFAPDGDAHPVGRDLTRGVMLAVESANAAGGIDGRPLRVIRRWADDPWGAGSREVIRLVFEDRVLVVIGGPDGASTHVAQQIATKAHLALIAPVSSDPSLTHTRVPWIFRLPPDDAAQAEALVRDGLAPRSLTAVGLIVSADHDGKAFADEFEAVMKRWHVVPIFKLAVDPDVDDPARLADRIQGFAPDGLVMRLGPAAARRMLAALQKMGIDCPVFLPWVPGLHLVEFPASYDGPVIQGSPFQPPPKCGPYLKMVQSGIRRYGTKPTASTAYGFDAANLVIEALRRGAEGRVELRQRLAELSGTEGASGTIRWDNGGGNTAEPVVIELPRQ